MDSVTFSVFVSSYIFVSSGIFVPNSDYRVEMKSKCGLVLGLLHRNIEEKTLAKNLHKSLSYLILVY